METVLNSMISNMSALPPPMTLPVTGDVPSSSQQHQLSEASAIKIETTSAPSTTQQISSRACRNTTTPNSIGITSTGETTSNNGRVEQPQPQLHQFQQRNTGRTFFRAPGLEAPDENSGDFPTNALVCPDCGFSCSSKFHYNSHRNTHSTHQCPICKFETRTEGRLKKHMLQSHKREQRLAAGINIQSPPPMPATLKQHSPTYNRDSGGDKCLAQQIVVNHGMSSDGMSLLNSVLSAGDNSANGTLALESLQSMLNNTNPLVQFSNSTDALLKICTDAITNNGPTDKPLSNSPQMGDVGHIPLEQLRALTERHTALLTTSTTNSLNFGELQIGADMGLIGTDTNQQQSTQQNGSDEKQDTPRRSGKPKQYKCKQCQHISRSKKEQWAHARLHIPKQKQLTCALCDFVTEYKHHLEYHYRNHNGQKPFKCTICDYTCVNKSMLNSHMKSHTPVYQFRCQDCTYQTKYCHSLKMHLKKYNHKRAPGPSGFVDSSDSHGEERPENASSSSIGREDTASFENGAPMGALPSDGHPEGASELIVALPSTVHQHDSLLNGPPPGDTAELEMTSHRLMLQQQLDQMNGFIRNAMVNCPHCSYSTGNIDEMNKHLLVHLILAQHPMSTALNNEQHALATIYQRVTALLHQELIPGGEGAAHPHQLMPSPLSHHQQSVAHSLLSRALAMVTTGSQQQQKDDDVPMELSVSAPLPSTMTSEEERALQMEREAVECIRQQHAQVEQHAHFTPTTVVEILAAVAQPPSRVDGTTMMAATSSGAEVESVRGGECTTDGTSTTTPTSNNNEPSNQRQQLSYSTTGKSLKREFSFGGGTFQSANDSGGSTVMQEQPDRGRATAEGGATGTCVITNVMPRLMSSIPGLSNGFETRASAGEEETSAGGGAGYGRTVSGIFSGGVQGPSGITLPYFCQQCEIAFKDAALYQVHRGFHARESMFKCNICGHLSSSSLDFNLHLYQAKHE
uniref:C2H2-type domain-containing protein n=1 Tax=Globodera rostochiensis TaxID=31243 RepID=A0A914GTU8_GLORO